MEAGVTDHVWSVEPLLIVAVLLVAFARTSAQAQNQAFHNFFNAIGRPDSEQDWPTKQVVQQLAASAVPTSKDAFSLGAQVRIVWASTTTKAVKIVFP
jgi:hypothetical protein